MNIRNWIQEFAELQLAMEEISSNSAPFKAKISPEYIQILIAYGKVNATQCVCVIKTSQLMLYREIIAVCSQIHTKHTKNTVWAEQQFVLHLAIRTNSPRAELFKLLSMTTIQCTNIRGHLADS
jgi:hypothetical protein